MATQPPNSASGGTPPVAAAVAAVPVTAKNAREMFFAIAIMSAFVYAAAVIAGTSQNTGRAVVAFFIGLIILQGVTHANPLAGFLASHPLTPTA